MESDIAYIVQRETGYFVQYPDGRCEPVVPECAEFLIHDVFVMKRFSIPDGDYYIPFDYLNYRLECCTLIVLSWGQPVLYFQPREPVRTYDSLMEELIDIQAQKLEAL